MIQLNKLDGDYNTDIDYGTVDESETQSPFGTSDPNEVIPTLFSSTSKRHFQMLWKMWAEKMYPRKFPVWYD